MDASGSGAREREVWLASVIPFRYLRSRRNAVANDQLTLADLPALRQAVVTAVVPMDEHGRRLLAIGFAPGTPVHFARRAPFRGPLVIDVRGAQICLRLRDARRVLVRAEPQP